jgi:hypothetical protein
MAKNRNPAAADDGGSEADHPDRAIGTELAQSLIPNQPAPPTRLIRNGNARTCASCGATIKPKRGSRRQRYCDARCRSLARRERNFSATGHTGQGAARSVKISPAISNTRKGENAGRGFPINFVGGYRWPRRKGVDAELARTILRIEICAISIVPLVDDGETGDLNFVSDNSRSKNQIEGGDQAGEGGGGRWSG